MGNCTNSQSNGQSCPCRFIFPKCNIANDYEPTTLSLQSGPKAYEHSTTEEDDWRPDAAGWK